MSPTDLPRALTAGLFAALLAILPVRAETLDKVSFGTNWVAEAEHGGFYQAVAETIGYRGTFAEFKAMR